MSQRNQRVPTIPCVALLLLGAIPLSGCGGGGVTGTYVHREVTEDGSSMAVQLELESGGKAIVTLLGAPDDPAFPSVPGTYVVEGDRITVRMQDGDVDVYERKGDTLTTEAFGEPMVLKKD